MTGCGVWGGVWGDRVWGLGFVLKNHHCLDAKREWGKPRQTASVLHQYRQGKILLRRGHSCFSLGANLNQQRKVGKLPKVGKLGKIS
uniref:Uncharacterized protein n=1 Tax=Moorena producens (strain JHB) TaxID=1454205 RepID=A0A1D9FYC5_MOOP1